MISILVASYNVCQTIERCLNSLEQQTYQEFEVVIVDDCSTDSTVPIIRNYIEKSKLVIRLYELRQNCGVSYVRNICIKNAKGSFFMFVDGDDWLSSNALELLVGKQKEVDADIVGCDFYIEGDKTKEIKLPIYNLKQAKESAVAGIWSVVWRHLFKSSFIEKLGINFPENLKAGEDYYFVVSSIVNSDRYSYVHECLYHYCVNNSNSLMHSLNIDAIIGQKVSTEMIQNEIDHFASKDVCIKRALEVRILYTKKEMLKYSLRFFKLWNPAGFSAIINQNLNLCDKIKYITFCLICKFVK